MSPVQSTDPDGLRQSFRDQRVFHWNQDDIPGIFGCEGARCECQSFLERLTSHETSRESYAVRARQMQARDNSRRKLLQKYRSYVCAQASCTMRGKPDISVTLLPCIQLQYTDHALADLACQRLIGATVPVFEDPRRIFILKHATPATGFTLPWQLVAAQARGPMYLTGSSASVSPECKFKGKTNSAATSGMVLESLEMRCMASNVESSVCVSRPIVEQVHRIAARNRRHCA